MLRCIVCVLLLGLGSALAYPLAPLPTPPAPADYNVQIRYRIDAFRTERIRQYREMLEEFKEAGFVRDPGEEVATDEPDNPAVTRMNGSIPAKGLPRLLGERHVRTLLVYPKASKLPDKDTPVRVEIRLASGYQPETQRRLARQTARVLSSDAGFVEAVGYDLEDGSRLVGSIPAGNLDKALQDPRQLPSAATIGQPLRNVAPIRLITVRPDLPAPSGMPKLPEVPFEQRKLSPDLRAALAANKGGDRLEVILGWTPSESDPTWLRVLNLPGVMVEGRVGPLVAVKGNPKDVALKLAELPDVVAVRLPRSGRTGTYASKGPVPLGWEPLRASGLARLHSLGKKGRGTKVAIVSDDFAGWEKLKGRKDGKRALPDPRLIDVTAERNPNLLPDSFPAGSSGYGTRCAESLLRAAPEAELTLVRIDAEAPYMLQTVAASLNGTTGRTLCLERRRVEIREENRRLELEGARLREERTQVFADASDDEEWIKRKKDYEARQKAHDAAEIENRERRDRYFAMVKDLQSLKGIRLIASTLVWTDGHPAGGASALSQFFNDRPFCQALWFQAAGDAGGQAWTGMFLDSDNNGLLDFVPADVKLPKGVWSSELNFLTWRNDAGKPAQDLPAGAKVRISLQWREAHDPLPLRSGEDVYREPLTKLRLYVLRQADPEGKSRPADDFDVVAISADPPQRLDQSLNSGIYEHSIDLTLDKPGRYAVLIEGKLPSGITAPGEGVLPITRKTGEVRPRLFVQTQAGAGRAVWSTFPSAGAALGTPADTRTVVTVGAATEKGQRSPESPSGHPAGLALVTKPEVIAFDEGGGTGQAASFAAGLAASAWPSTGSLAGMLDRLRDMPGQLLRVPVAKERPR